MVKFYLFCFCLLLISKNYAQDSLKNESRKKISAIEIRQQKNQMIKSDKIESLEIYTNDFFSKNPSPSLFESLQNINGIRPQIQCNICNTGDIRINGMDGPYTTILIDGMPIVSGLGTVYGLFGIPMGIIQKMEISKGPAPSLYASEAMAGTINIITKIPKNQTEWVGDISGNSYGEMNIDAASSFMLNKKINALLGFNGFLFNSKHDVNNDGFMDRALTDRFSLFNKFNFQRNDEKSTQFAYRVLYEKRSGGAMNFNDDLRGSDSIYGESIHTKRAEIIGNYDLPFKKEDFKLQYSANIHHQNSFYGNNEYLATQAIGFLQLIYNKKIKQHQFLFGTSHRYTIYDDNSDATLQVFKSYLPGIFAQDAWSLSTKTSLLLGGRLDYNAAHGIIYSPRLGIKHEFHPNHAIRFNAGQGFRVVNVFSEEHGAFSGGRTVVLEEALKPEQSINLYGNYNQHFNTFFGFIKADHSVFYNYFSNRIFPDYFSNSEQIIFRNLKDFAVNYGISSSLDFNFKNRMTAQIGGTYLQSYWLEDGVKNQLAYTPNWTFNYSIGYEIPKIDIKIDLTSNIVGPMRLPVFENDYRNEFSPWYQIINLQFSKKWFSEKIESYFGIKNLLDFTPKEDIIMRPFDPFDKNVDDPINNPNNFTFDPSYNYAPMQFRTFYLGVRFHFH
jgi:outer membrane receptor for ferrienterochelin and colicins